MITKNKVEKAHMIFTIIYKQQYIHYSIKKRKSITLSYLYNHILYNISYYEEKIYMNTNC